MIAQCVVLLCFLKCGSFLSRVRLELRLGLELRRTVKNLGKIRWLNNQDVS